MSSEPTPGWLQDMTRRDALRRAAVGGAALGASGCSRPVAAATAAAAGAANTGTGAPAPVKLRAGGALRIGSTGGGAKDTIDAHLPTTDPDIMRQWNLYESLAVRTPDFSELQMLIAESIEPVGSKPTRGPSASRTASSSTTARRSAPTT
jgi:peptide/nickel transport system substrate-binding protein